MNIKNEKYGSFITCLQIVDDLPCRKVKVKSLSHVRLFATVGLLHPWDFLGKNTGVDCHFLLQEIFPTQGLNPGLLHCRPMLYHLSHQGSPSMQEVMPNFSPLECWQWENTWNMVFKTPDIKKKKNRGSLVFQWLRLHTPDTGGPGSISGQGASSHMPN